MACRRISTWLLIGIVFGWLQGCAGLHSGGSAASHSGHGQADLWIPEVEEPAFAAGTGPRVLIDAAHGNWHTADGRYAPFAELLRRDGYRVAASDRALADAAALAEADVLVIANAVLGGEASVWELPTPAAFTQAEIEMLERWVAGGGALFLIADHMPFPGAVQDLAAAFGLVFYNGYALESPSGRGTLRFTRASGSLADHAITRGRRERESVAAVKAFTGQAFRAVVPLEPLLVMPDEWGVYLPKAAGEIHADTPWVPARGLLQGAVLRHGRGRIAVFGEAAMFTAQAFRDASGDVVRVGLNDPDAALNAQFALNVMHWLGGLLDEPPR